MKQPTYPSLYQINTRVWLTQISKELERPATLDDIPESELIRLAELGFDWIWFLSVWTTGEMGQSISRNNPEWRKDFEATLPDLKEEDIAGSGFAIAGYHVHPGLGGDEALKRLRSRLQKYGLKLMLDFVPNHMGPDHPWVQEHPEYFVSGTAKDLEQFPLNYTTIKRGKNDIILAYGRDPYFSGWPDTVQLDYNNPATAAAMTNELLRISGQCDGLRCDMAMLILPEIFERTWGRRAQSFWPEAIKAVHENSPGFCLMAEVYWEMEWRLQQEGFDYTYDKRLYDRLVEGHARAIREHFYADPGYQDKMVRFLENHDEQRAAATFNSDQQEAAAVLTFLSPGLRFFHQGQFEGRKKRISPHLVRAPQEQKNITLQKFYTALLTILKKPIFRYGKWQLLETVQAWEDNISWDSFIAFAWQQLNENRVLVIVNYAAHHSQCYLRLPFPELAGANWHFQDQMGETCFNRDGNNLQLHGLYLDMKPWQFHVLDMKIIEPV